MVGRIFAFTLSTLVASAFVTLLGCSGSVSDASNTSGGATPAGGGNTAASPATGGTTSTATTCPDGTERCACYGNDTCNAGLTCASHLCVRLGTGGTGSTGGTSAIGGKAAAGSSGLGGASILAGASAVAGHSAVGGALSSGGAAAGGVNASGGQAACSGPNPPSSCHWVGPAGCGDGIVDTTNEQCDDGNALPGDGCSGTCQIEPNSTCPPRGGACMPSFVCGDGVVNPGEQCDQGTYQGSPGCSADCKTQDSGYRCVPGQRCEALFQCGNGRIETGETCDPPNPGNGCGSACQTEAGWRCKPGSCYKLPFCGDGIVQTSLGEKCDQGAYQGSPGCTSDCRSIDADCTCTPGAKCTCVSKSCDAGACNYGGSCPAGCGPAPRCGDGLVQLDYSEECDDGVNNGAYGGCTSSCKFAAYCGDGIANGDSAHPEACDDGINDGLYNTCGVGCTLPPRCGDGIVQSDWDEQCEPVSADDPNCSQDCKLPGFCGDGVVQPQLNEQCDYGSALNTGVYGGCNPNCTLAPYCGDGVTNGPEQCDLGSQNSVIPAIAADCLYLRGLFLREVGFSSFESVLLTAHALSPKTLTPELLDA